MKMFPANQLATANKKHLHNPILPGGFQGKNILIFQHEPISTGDPKDAETEPVFPINSEKPRIENFYNTRNQDVQALAEELEFYRKNTAQARGGN